MCGIQSANNRSEHDTETTLQLLRVKIPFNDLYRQFDYFIAPAPCEAIVSAYTAIIVGAEIYCRIKNKLASAILTIE
jgi:hypothetical protein